MGKMDILTKEYMSNPERFADAFNYLFGKKNLIRHQYLREMDTAELGIVFGNRTADAIQRMRDLLKECILMQDEAVAYVLLGIENQTDVHYAMAVKNMIYDALNYGGQISNIRAEHQKKKDLKGGAEFLSGFQKGDRLKPVVTLTIYFGTGEWDAARSLSEMFGAVDSLILDYVNDYKLNLIVPSEIEDFSLFRTELRNLLQMIAAADSKDAVGKLMEDESFTHLSIETVRLINSCTGAEIPIEDGVKEVNMCKGIEDMKRHAMESGVEQGTQMATTLAIQNMLELGVSEEKILSKYSQEELNRAREAAASV